MIGSDGCARLFPTFAQFLQYVAETPAKFDSHWAPYAKTCAPCLVEFDAIVKLETADADQAKKIIKI